VEAGGELAAREASFTRAAEQVAVVVPESGSAFSFLGKRRAIHADSPTSLKA